MKYRDNMTPEEFAKFMEEVNALDALLKSIPTIKTIEGHWQDDPATRYCVNVSLGSWDGIEDEKDRDIFYYMDGEPLRVGDVIANDFVVTNI
jgi:hypothetical protein